MKKTLTLLVLLFLYPCLLYGDTTYVEGHLTAPLTTWDTAGSPYIVTNDVYVDSSCTLRIEPSVEVLFKQPYTVLYQIIVNGYLLAEGTEEDSIIFSYDTLIDPDVAQWGAIMFDNPEDTISVLKYCRLIYGYWCVITAHGSQLIENCSIIMNTVPIPLCGVYCWNDSRPKIIGNFFTSFCVRGERGIVLENSTDAFIRNNKFVEIGSGIIMYDNTSAIIDSNEFKNSLYGIEIFNSSPNCDILIRWNVFEEISSIGIDVVDCPSIIKIINNTIAQNGYGIAVGYDESNPELINNIFKECGGEGFEGAIGIDPDVSDLLIKNSLFFNNFNDFGGWAYVIPPGVKEIVTTNVNGDSCDTFFNLFMDPYFADTDSYFLSDSSPCIDAGDPTLPWDPDGTPPDIGAHYYDQRDWVNPVRRVPPRKPALYPGYPNPFNTRVTVEYELNNPLQYVVLDVLDIRGKVVSTLVSAYKPKGWHRATWDGNAPNGEPLPSGVYLVRLREYNRKHVQKVLLIR